MGKSFRKSAIFLIAQGIFLSSQSVAQCPCNSLSSTRESFAAAVVHVPLFDYHGFVFGGRNAAGTLLATGELLYAGYFVCLPSVATFALPAGVNTNASAVYSNVTGKIYLIGGNDGTSDLATVWEFDPTTYAWTAKAPMSTPRSSAGATEIGGKIYIAGGKNGGSVLNSLEEYDPVSNTWVTRAPMTQARYGLEFHPGGTSPWPVTMTHGFAMGGINFLGIKTAVNERYNPTTNTWATMAAMPTALAWFAGWKHADPLGYYIAIMGGENSAGALVSTISLYSPVTNTWPVTGTSILTSCGGVSRLEAFQTGDMTDLVFSSMSVGGRDVGGVATNHMRLHGSWAVLDDKDLVLEGKWKAGMILLSWDLKSAHDVSGFVAEVAVDGRNFESTSHEHICSGACADAGYQLDFRDDFEGRASYRIRMIYKDGSITYSNTVHPSGPSEESLVIQPYRDDGLIVISGGDLFGSEVAEIEIISLEGKTVATGHKPAMADSFHLGAGNLTSGIYFASIRYGSRVITRKFFW